MKFIAGNSEDTAARLVALSEDAGHGGDQVVSMSMQGFWVEDDVADAYDSGSVGTLDITATQNAGTTEVGFVSDPPTLVEYVPEPDAARIVATDGVATYTYPAEGSYTAVATSPGRSSQGWTVVVAPPVVGDSASRQPRKRSESKESHNG